jgi:hypothetical protein
MKQFILTILTIFCCLKIGYAQTAESDFLLGSNTFGVAALEAASPSTFPNIQYYLTARSWQA